MKSLNFIDLFSGCGGFSYGLEQAGHRCLLGVDFDPAAIDSFAANHPQAVAAHMDIHKLSSKKLNDMIDVSLVDMVVGGPPCQGFSTVGKGLAQDERNSLFKQFVRIVKLTQPKVIIFENVTGLVAKKNEKTLSHIFKSFERLGFNLEAQVLSAEGYGVPSRRRRTIIMGVKAGSPVFPRRSSRTMTVADAFRRLDRSKRTVLNHDLDSAKINNELDIKRLKHIPPGRGIRYQRDELELLPKSLRYDISWEELRENRFRQTRLQRIPLNQPAPTILTSKSMYYHPTDHRYLTAREAAMLQSFPLSFEFKGSVTSQFRQIGNAVPPKLAFALGKSIYKIGDTTTEAQRLLERQKVAAQAFNYKAS